jgi:AraC family transcriptional regulator
MNSGQASTTSDSYGRGLAKHWGLDDLPSIVTRSLRGAEIVVSDLRVNKPNGRLSDPLPRDDAYMICLVLRDLPQNSYWEEGREVARYSLKRGQTAISDLRREPVGLISQPIHTMLFNLPRAAINGLADDINVPRIDELEFHPGVGMFDETIMHLGLSLMPALATPNCASRLFTDHITLALAAHVAQTYGGMQAAPKLVTGGLAPWQEKRSKEMLAGDLTGATPLHEIAVACGLSVNHFSRAFHKSTGLERHRMPVSRVRRPVESLAIQHGHIRQGQFKQHIGCWEAQLYLPLLLANAPLQSRCSTRRIRAERKAAARIQIPDCARGAAADSVPHPRR